MKIKIMDMNAKQLRKFRKQQLVVLKKQYPEKRLYEWAIYGIVPWVVVSDKTPEPMPESIGDVMLHQNRIECRVLHRLITDQKYERLFLDFLAKHFKVKIRQEPYHGNV